MSQYATASRTARYLRQCRNMRHCRLRRFELRCAKGLGPLGAPLDEGSCEQQAIQPRREDYSPGTRNGPHRRAQIRTFAFSQRDEYSLRTSKFESDMPSHGVGLYGARRPQSSGVAVSPAGAVPLIMAVMTRGDTKTSGARWRTCRSACPSRRAISAKLWPRSTSLIHLRAFGDGDQQDLAVAQLHRRVMRRHMHDAVDRHRGRDCPWNCHMGDFRLNSGLIDKPLQHVRRPTAQRRYRLPGRRARRLTSRSAV